MVPKPSNSNIGLSILMERPRDDWPSSYFDKFKYPNWNSSFEVLSYVEKLTMSNQNKKMSNLFLGTEFGKLMGFFVKRSSNAPTGVDRRTQKEEKKILA